MVNCFLTKVQEKFNGETTDFSTNCVETIDYPICKKIESRTDEIKSNSKWIIGM